MIDIELLMQEEATQNQYIIDFVLMNVIFFIAYLNKDKGYRVMFTWFMILIFCLYAFWDTDYFSFRYIFHTELKGYRDPLYYYLGEVSFGSYTIFRLLIWGTALYLFKKTIDRFKISSNIAAFIFAIFYLLTFSFGRISLGIAMYFYGVSILLSDNKKMSDYVWGLLLIAGSYLGHRAMIVPIVLTPIMMLRPNKILITAILVIGIIVGQLAASFVSDLIVGSLVIGSGIDAEEALLDYIANENDVTMNWKFALTSSLRWYSIYILMAYCIWVCFFSAKKTSIALEIQRLVILCTVIFIIAFNFQQFDTIGASEIGERILYMLGIPLVTTLSYFRDKNICSTKVMLLLLLPALMYAEGFIFGKILSF